jgi:hypothetical protein
VPLSAKQLRAVLQSKRMPRELLAQMRTSVESADDLTDFFFGHPELRTPNTIDLSDYFLRH